MAREIHTDPASPTMIQALKIRTLIASSSVFQTAVGVETVEEAEERVYVNYVKDVDAADKPYAIIQMGPTTQEAVAGGSQGGGLTLATAALAEGRVAVAAAHVPFLCHYEWVLDNPVEGGPFREIKDYQAENPDLRDTMSNTLSYFDPVNLAERIACPVYLSMGERDVVCPPPTIRAVYDRIGTTKTLLSEPEMTHEWLPDSHEHVRHWLIHHLS